MILEQLDHAKSRGANIYAELSGFGINSDAYHMTAPSPSGVGAAACMRLAIEDGKLNLDQIDYINAHGTSTPAGDKAESDAIKSLFNEHSSKLAISSTKSMVGHMLGAAGGAEAVYTVMSIKDQVAPPTINYETPDPECDLNCVPNEARKMEITHALTNSLALAAPMGPSYLNDLTVKISWGIFPNNRFKFIDRMRLIKSNLLYISSFSLLIVIIFSSIIFYVLNWPSVEKELITIK